MSTEGPTEEQIQALEEQLRRVDVGDLLLQTAVTLINVAGFKLSEEHDLEQAKVAIEGTRALMPLLPVEAQAQLKPLLSQLQMAFVRESQHPGGEPEAPEGQPDDAPRGPEEAHQATEDEAERAKARSKIWTPPGT
jgi:hypothetical protein